MCTSNVEANTNEYMVWLKCAQLHAGVNTLRVVYIVHPVSDREIFGAGNVL